MACIVCLDLRPEPVCHSDVKNGVPRSDLLTSKTPFIDLCHAADSGCVPCKIIKEGIYRFEDTLDIESVHIRSWLETSATKPPYMPGERSILEVEVFTYSSKQTKIQFYTSNKRVASRWPCLKADPISADSSSPECMSLASKWLEECLQNHLSGACRTGTRANLPTRVIHVGDDITNPSLYESSAGECGTYAALSYCWGRTRSFTTRTSLAQRIAGFALEDLPRTIRDAIQVARGLKIPYLWVDSLCSVQDCAVGWAFEAATMHLIYKNAIATFAAIDSPDSESGLFLRSATRRTAEISVNLDDGLAPEECQVKVRYKHYHLREWFVHHKNDPSDKPAKDILKTRGWTLQELTVSPRLFWFTQSELAWSCGERPACEGGPRGRCSGSYGFPSKRRIGEFAYPHTFIACDSMSDLLNEHKDGFDWKQLWRNIVVDFSHRHLTFQKDRIPALSGLASIAYEFLGGQYLCGIWDADIAIQLLWQSAIGWGRHKNQTRQHPAPDETEFLRVQDSDYAPSWSWASVCHSIWYD